MTRWIAAYDEVTADTGRATRITPITFPSATIGSATYRSEAPIVALVLRSRPTPPAKAASTSGRLPWFSTRGRSSTGTSESPSTRPSAAITVIRESVGREPRTVKAWKSSGEACRVTSVRASSCRSRPMLARRASSVSTANASSARLRYRPATTMVTATKPTSVNVSLRAMLRRRK